MNQEISERQW